MVLGGGAVSYERGTPVVLTPHPVTPHPADTGLVSRVLAHRTGPPLDEQVMRQTPEPGLSVPRRAYLPRGGSVRPEAGYPSRGGSTYSEAGLPIARRAYPSRGGPINPPAHDEHGMRHTSWPALVHRLCDTTDHSENSEIENCTERYSSQFENNCFTEMRGGSEEGSYLRLIDLCITQL